MKKATVLFLFLASFLMTDAADICLTINNGNIDIVKDAMWGLYRCPVDTNNVPIYTKSQWAKLCLKKWVVQQVRRWKDANAIDSLKHYNDSLSQATGDSWIQ
jgi:hypothetical protein